jgi:hypothetical protein
MRAAVFAFLIGLAMETYAETESFDSAQSAQYRAAGKQA